MKTRFYPIALMALVALYGVSCSPESGNTDAEGAAAVAQSAVCLWDQAGLRDKPGKSNDAKYLASINFGEQLTLTGKRVEDSTDSKKPYVEVTLADGKKGWVQEYLLALNATRAVATGNITLYKRPELSTMSGDNLAEGDLFSFNESQPGWAEVFGKEKKKKGWISLDASSYSQKEADVAVAVMVNTAMREKDPAKQEKLLNEIINNPALSTSSLVTFAESKLNSIAALPQLPENQLYITGDVVNIRTEPDNEDATNVSFQLKRGDICNILARGDRQQIRDMNEYWYQIEKDGQSGWVYGFFTSKKLP
ncbi:MAG: SH3 domain-containing protein [Bacteroidia bacterium]|nr:SH3 domain-containing protein [Bacteroidia bacterium]